MINKSSIIETVYMQEMEVSLLASGDSTEVIYHKLPPNTRWALGPEDGWNALEYIFILTGELRLKTADGYSILKKGDSFYRCPVNEHFAFISLNTVEFLYVTSQPVFHNYSKVVKEMVELAISIEEKDGYTRDHCLRISRLSMLLGEKMALAPRQMVILNLASFFHDIGKLKVPIDILQKPGKLTPDEWDIMKMHPTFGKELLIETGIPILISVARIIEQHHERYDGKGYPNQLAFNEIDILASIITVIDSFDAMTTDRVYQKGRTKEEAFEEILRCRGTMYHPDVVDIFLDLKSSILGEEL